MYLFFFTMHDGRYFDKTVREKKLIISWNNGFLIQYKKNILIVSNIIQIFNLKKLIEMEINPANILKKKIKFIFFNKVCIHYLIKNEININPTNFYNNFELYNLSKILLIELLFKKKIINYYKKNIEFVIYDYICNDENFLLSYTILSLKITHTPTCIVFDFQFKDLIIAVEIACIKFEELSNSNNDMFLINNNLIFNITNFSKWNIFTLIAENDINSNYKILINSKNKYDFTQEKNVIVYFNTNDQYDNHYLNLIIKTDDKPFIFL